MKVGPSFTPLITIKSKWNKAFNIKPEIISLIEENSGENPLNIGLVNHFFTLVMIT